MKISKRADMRLERLYCEFEKVLNEMLDKGAIAPQEKHTFSRWADQIMPDVWAIAAETGIAFQGGGSLDGLPVDIVENK